MKVANDSAISTEETKIEDEDIKAIDMDLEEKKDNKDDLKEDTPLPNIWSFDADETEKDDKFDKPSFLRRFKKHKKTDEDKK